MPRCEVGSKMRPDIRFGSDIIIAFWAGLDFSQVASEEEIAGMAFSEMK